MKAFVKIIESCRTDYMKRGAAAICLGILGSEDEGSKFTRMIRMQMAKKNVRDLREGEPGFE
jgi:hypothetical protein